MKKAIGIASTVILAVMAMALLVYDFISVWKFGGPWTLLFVAGIALICGMIWAAFIWTHE